MKDDKLFLELSPAEVAVFWLATDTNPRKLGKTEFICSPSTLIIGIGFDNLKLTSKAGF
ncbi:MAG: hypothetical protein ACLPN1_19335 [Dissulfurispiraceae bacterium]